jgi:Uma2 family endonuclease
VAQQAKKLATVEDLLARIATDERAELIEGEIVYKASPSSEHGFSAVRIGQILAPFDRKGGGGGQPPGGWWIGADIHVIYEGRANGFLHDLVGWRRDRHSEKPKGRRVTAKPDWVCEILSTNRSNDLVTKRLVLHEHRVEYFWLVDTDAQMVSVLKWSDKGYTIIADAAHGQKARLEPFADIEIDVSVLLGGDPD